MESLQTIPVGFKVNLYNTWLLVNSSRSYTAWLHQRYGDIVALIDPQGSPFVIALTAKAARVILSADPDGYDAFWKEGFTGVAGIGSLWVLGGNEHRQERQLLTPAFHTRSFRGYGEIIRSVTRQETANWQPDQRIRVLDTTRAISLDIIMRLVFGITEEKFMEEGRKILFSLWSTMHPLFVFFPGLQRGWFPPWRRYARAKKNFKQWVNHIVIERRLRNEETEDILGRMLTAQYEDGSIMLDEDICDELITILLAGHETTATAMAWVLYELGRNPVELEKLRNELDPLGPEPDPGLIAKLPFLSAVCNETIRLHTLLPEVARVLVSPMQIFGYTIPAGGTVGVSIMAIHHDQELYQEPDRFNPDRFLESTYSPFEFLPFGGGHRRCIGSALSDYELRIAVAEITSHWELEPIEVEREIRHDIAMGPKNGVRLHIKGRRNTILN